MYMVMAGGGWRCMEVNGDGWRALSTHYSVTRSLFIHYLGMDMVNNAQIIMA